MTSRRISILFATLALYGSALAQASPAQQARADEVRKQLDAVYARWGKARDAIDNDIFEKTLAPDFFASMNGQKQSRKEFIEEISKKGPNAKLTRFDSDILTLTQQGTMWVAVIGEKLEADIKDKQGKIHKAFAYFVTRDGWTQADQEWQAHYTEVIGAQFWTDRTPPLDQWSA